MSFFKNFREEMENGIQEKQSWIPLLHTKMNRNIVYGKSMYFIFGGLPGK